MIARTIINTNTMVTIVSNFLWYLWKRLLVTTSKPHCSYLFSWIFFFPDTTKDWVEAGEELRHNNNYSSSHGSNYRHRRNVAPRNQSVRHNHNNTNTVFIGNLPYFASNVSFFLHKINHNFIKKGTMYYHNVNLKL